MKELDKLSRVIMRLACLTGSFFEIGELMKTVKVLKGARLTGYSESYRELVGSLSKLYVSVG